MNGENRRRVFEPIKGYILFSTLSAEKFANCKKIVELVTPDEIGPLLLHLLNKEYPVPIVLKTTRKTGASVCSVFISDSDLFDVDAYDYDHEEEDFTSIEMHLTVNRRVSIRAIHTTCPDYLEDFDLGIQGLNRKSLNLEMKRFVKDGKWSFSLDPPFDVEPNCSYTLFAGVDGEILEETREQSVLDYKGTVIFNVQRESPNYLEFHCIRGLDFVLLDQSVLALETYGWSGEFLKIINVDLVCGKLSLPVDLES